MTNPKRDPLTIVRERALAVRTRYRESGHNQTTNFLIYGDYGTGKTQLAATCPQPVLIHSFDPGGTKTAALQPLIETGAIIVDSRFENDSWKSPEAFRLWEQEFQELRRSDFFAHVGTYILDSVTAFSDRMMYEILKKGDKKGGSRAGGKPELQDYMVQQITTIDILSQICSLPCHTITTGHIGRLRDEVSGAFETGLLLAGKLSDKVPLVFDEKYISRVVQERTGTRHVLQTKTEGIYKAETRMGGVNFDTFEEPDIKALLRKAGRDDSDKESLFDD